MCTERGEPTPDRRARGGFRFGPDGSVTYWCFRCRYGVRWSPGEGLGRGLRRLAEAFGVDVGDLAVAVAAAAGTDGGSRPTPMERTSPTFRLPPDWSRLGDALGMPEPPAHVKAVAEWLVGRGLYGPRACRYVHVVLDARAPLAGCAIFLLHEGGRCVGWTARRLRGEGAKWIARRTSGSVYFACRPVPGRILPVCEGPADALALAGAAVLGSRPGREQLHTLRSLDCRLVWVPDRDAAGLRDAVAVCETGVDVSIPSAADEPVPGPWPAGAKDAAEAAEICGSRAWVTAAVVAARLSDPRAVAARVAILRAMEKAR